MTFSFSDLIREEWNASKGHVVKTCTSTMDLAWDFNGRGLFPELAFVLAEHQTQGRGQFGREWVSKSGNLFVTLRLPNSAHGLDTLLPLAMGLCVVRAFEALHIPALIKWPNDIMINTAKVGGILIEKKGLVIMAGLGLNLDVAPENSPGEKFFHVKAGCLKESGVNLKPSEAWSLISEQIKRHLSGMISDPSRVAEESQRRLAFRGETVVLENTDIFDGPARVLGIDSQGRLIIETIKGIRSISQGRIYPRVV